MGPTGAPWGFTIPYLQGAQKGSQKQREISSLHHEKSTAQGTQGKTKAEPSFPGTEPLRLPPFLVHIWGLNQRDTGRWGDDAGLINTQGFLGQARVERPESEPPPVSVR